jgi:hypothetical protein
MGINRAGLGESVEEEGGVVGQRTENASIPGHGGEVLRTGGEKELSLALSLQLSHLSTEEQTH